MNLSRHAITAGIVVLSLAGSASPALAKGGGGDGRGDINNTVIQIAPSVVPTTTNGGGGGGKRAKCTSVLVDPVNMVFVGTCTTNRV